MAESFYTILTKVGQAKIANAYALGTKLNLTQFKVGDGAGSYYNPTSDATALKNQVWSGNISSIYVDNDNPNWIVAEVVIPASDGGFMIREAGIFDDTGNMIAIGKYPETYKPVLADGSAKDLYIKMILEVSNTASITLKLDPSAVLATKKDIQNIIFPVMKVNGKTGDITLKAIDIKTEDGTTLEKVKEDFVSHSADNLYQVAGGSATAITLTIKGTLVTGYPITFIASANNNSSATTINGKSLYKPGTTIAPNLVSGKAYAVWYNASANSGNGCFFIKASAEGDVTPGDVLAGKIFSNKDDVGLVGTMPNYVNRQNTGYIGVKSVRSDGGGTLVVEPFTGYYQEGLNSYGFGSIIMTEPNLIPANILSGKSIFGVVGTATKKYATGSIASIGTGANYTISGLTFIPKFIYMTYTNSSSPLITSCFKDLNTNAWKVVYDGTTSTYALTVASEPTTNAFTIHNNNGSWSMINIQWYASE